MKTLLGALCLFTASAFAQVSVSVSAPVANSNISSPIQLHATASSSHPITGWQVYLDSNSVYAGPATGTISTSINAGQGTHTLVVRAWDTTGAFGDKTLTAIVASSDTTPPPTSTAGLPTPPSNAKVFSN